jgi:L-2-hydroxyglutarate oxidase
VEVLEEQRIIDVAIIGAGAIGMSTAYHLSEAGLSVAVLEKESGPAMHQSGRNSGVIHAGYNPKPGTQKARYCVEGNRQLRAFCYDNGVPVREGGILIVAQTDQEMDVVSELYERGLANGTNVMMLGEDDIGQVEPHAHGIGALRAADGASFDARGYVQSLVNHTEKNNGRIIFDTRVKRIDEHDKGVTLRTSKGRVNARVVVNAAGLYADELADELSENMRIVPFRGYYAELVPGKEQLVNSHIYAAPDLNFPFLGVHLSKRADGRVIVGPGAMLAFGREAYSFGSFDGGRLASTLLWPGFRKMMQKPEFQNLIRTEINKSLRISAIGREAMKLVPDLHPRDLKRSFAGNRAQMVDRDGNLVDDIVVRRGQHSLHVLNAVSPGLTCSLPFGRDLAQSALELLNTA